MPLFRPFILRLVLLLLFKCFSSSFWAWLLGTPTRYRLKIVFLSTCYANNSLNCAGIANICHMREVCEKNRVGRNNCELASKPTSQSRVISQWSRSWHAVRGGIDPGDNRYGSRVVGAVEIRGISKRGWGPISPVCDGTVSPIGWQPLSYS